MVAGARKGESSWGEDYTGCKYMKENQRMKKSQKFRRAVF